MPVFGAHMSVAGGLTNAVSAASAHGCGTLQIFTKNPNTWVGKTITDENATAFRRAVADARLAFTTSHNSYLINLAAANDTLYRKSVVAFADELDRAEQLGLDFLVTHPGAHVGGGETAGLTRLVRGLNEVLSTRKGYRARVLLETTAGQGTYLGGRFEHFRAILGGVNEPERYGVCLDTCHVFAAGYDLRTTENYEVTFNEFDRVVGLEWLKLFHVNDSAAEYCSRVDRHAGLGQGEIGLEAFRRLVTDPRFADHPMILETPKEDAAGNPMDSVNLAILRGFASDCPVR